MSKECFTTRELTYRDEMEGELVYESEFGTTTVERTDERMIVKVRISKFQNFMQTADELWCELKLLSNWLWEKEKARLTDISQLEALPRDEEACKYRIDMWRDDRDPYLYMYFHSDYNWVIYENDEQYLFLYEMPITDKYELGISEQIAALGFWTKDDAGAIVDFLRSWYERVNGFSEVENDE